MHSIIQYLKQFYKTNITPMNVIALSRSALLSNYRVLQSLHPGDEIFPVLKSNAYGHGIKEIASILKELSPAYICVDSFPEYQIVRDVARCRSLIFGETLVENYHAFDPRWATLAVSNIETLKVLIQSGKKRTIHLFINTGMNREGLQQDELMQVLALLELNNRVVVEGVMSHFSDADELDSAHDFDQISRFSEMLFQVQKRIVQCQKSTLKYIHIANSAGTIKYDTTTSACTAWRSGLALYGYHPLYREDICYDRIVGLQPVLSVSSRVVKVQQLTTGDPVSYGSTWRAPHAGYVVVVPFGYAEGLPRSASNTWKASIDGMIMPQVGRICMNLSCYRCGSHRPELGSRVTLLGGSLALEDLASTSAMIPYELLTGFDTGIRREIIF